MSNFAKKDLPPICDPFVSDPTIELQLNLKRITWVAAMRPSRLPMVERIRARTAV